MMKLKFLMMLLAALLWSVPACSGGDAEDGGGDNGGAEEAAEGEADGEAGGEAEESEAEGE